MEFLILLIIVPFGLWSFRKIFRAMAKDRELKAVWRSFAGAKNLTETVVEQNESGITEITMTVVKQAWSKNPVKKRPGVGFIVFSGTNNGLPFFMDSVQVDKRWTDLMDTYTRMAIKVPDMPVLLNVRGKRRWSRLKKDLELNNREFDRLFIVDGDDSAKDYLTQELREALVGFEKNFSGVQIFKGHIYLIRKGGISKYSELERMYSGLWSLAHRFKKGNSSLQPNHGNRNTTTS